MGEVVGDTVVVGVGSALGAIDGESVGLAVGSVSAISTSLGVDGTKRTTPAPSGGTDTIVQPAPDGPAGEQLLTDRPPTVTSTLM